MQFQVIPRAISRATQSLISVLRTPIKSAVKIVEPKPEPVPLPEWLDRFPEFNDYKNWIEEARREREPVGKTWTDRHKAFAEYKREWPPTTLQDHLEKIEFLLRTDGVFRNRDLWQQLIQRYPDHAPDLLCYLATHFCKFNTLDHLCDLIDSQEVIAALPIRKTCSEAAARLTALALRQSGYRDVELLHPRIVRLRPNEDEKLPSALEPARWKPPQGGTLVQEIMLSFGVYYTSWCVNRSINLELGNTLRDFRPSYGDDYYWSFPRKFDGWFSKRIGFYRLNDIASHEILHVYDSVMAEYGVNSARSTRVFPRGNQFHISHIYTSKHGGMSFGEASDYLWGFKAQGRRLSSLRKKLRTLKQEGCSDVELLRNLAFEVSDIVRDFHSDLDPANFRSVRMKMPSPLPFYQQSVASSNDAMKLFRFIQNGDGPVTLVQSSFPKLHEKDNVLFPFTKESLPKPSSGIEHVWSKTFQAEYVWGDERLNIFLACSWPKGVTVSRRKFYALAQGLPAHLTASLHLLFSLELEGDAPTEGEDLLRLWDKACHDQLPRMHSQWIADATKVLGVLENIKTNLEPVEREAQDLEREVRIWRGTPDLERVPAIVDRLLEITDLAISCFQSVPNSRRIGLPPNLRALEMLNVRSNCKLGRER